MRSTAAVTSSLLCILFAISCGDVDEDVITILGPRIENEIAASDAPLRRGRWAVDMIVVGGSSVKCAIDRHRDAYCWGANDRGQLGDGTTTDRWVPTPVVGGHAFVDIDAAGEHTCGVAVGGRAYCWGLNDDGQLGDGTTTNRATPTRVRFDGAFASITVGNRRTCALDEDGSAWCWGNGGDGQLGSGEFGATVPSRVLGGLRFASIEANDEDTCALQADGTGYCWGWEQGEPARVGGALRFTALVPGVGTGSATTCGIATDRSTYCWRDPDVNAPLVLEGGHEFVALSDDGSFCGMKENGDIYCWTVRSSGALELVTPLIEGHGFTNFTGGLDVPLSFGDGLEPLCALDSDGFAYCRGLNQVGQLGNGTTESTTELTPVFPPTPPGTPAVAKPLIGGITARSVTLRWAQVDDGTGRPAWYRVKYAQPRIDWNTATVGCRRTLRGDEIGAEMSCTVEGLRPDTEYEFQLMAFRSESGVWVAATFSGVATGSTGSLAVDDLTVIERDDGETDIAWTQVDDGTGRPARYRLKHASEIGRWKDATTACTIVGTEIGGGAGCTLDSEAFYDGGDQFEAQLMSYRVDENGVWRDARYSNVVIVPREPYSFDPPE